LNVKTFKGLEGKIYCPTHTPVNRSSTSADSVSVKTAKSAPKKKAEGLSAAYKGDTKTAKGPAGEVVRSTDAAPSATDQSTSGGGTADRLGDAGAYYAPEHQEEHHHDEGGEEEEQHHHHEQHHHEEQGGDEGGEEEPYEDQPAEEEQYDE